LSPSKNLSVLTCPVVTWAREKIPHEPRRIKTDKEISLAILQNQPSMLIFGMVVAMSISMNAESVKGWEASADGSSPSPRLRGWIAKTAGITDRTAVSGRARRQDKRDCKQQGRQQPTLLLAPAPGK
jgi:hypothetical protein